MKYRAILAAIYAITTLCLGSFLDYLYNGEPITRHLGLIHAATVGAILFAVACVLSVFSLRLGIVCALVACILSWSYFCIQLSIIPWGDLIWFARYRPGTLAAILSLIVSSAYSVIMARLVFRPSSAK
jgi:hypothetical protein